MPSGGEHGWHRAPLLTFRNTNPWQGIRVHGRTPTVMRTRTDHSPLPLAADPLTRIATALDTVIAEIHAVIAIPHGTNSDNANRAALLARLNARQAGWWRLLARAAVTGPTRVHPIYVRAALRAAHQARDDARFWRDAAADWTARAEHRPTSDAAGALSNWHELGVTA